MILAGKIRSTYKCHPVNHRIRMECSGDRTTDLRGDTNRLSFGSTLIIGLNEQD